MENNKDVKFIRVRGKIVPIAKANWKQGYSNARKNKKMAESKGLNYKERLNANTKTGKSHLTALYGKDKLAQKAKFQTRQKEANLNWHEELSKLYNQKKGTTGF